MSDKGHFDPEREIHKYKLDHSTFDLIDIDKFHNTRFSTVFFYIWSWILIILTWVLLGVDIYTCLNILVFHRWSNKDYQPYAYSIAKWIFTGCIIFQFLLVLYHWVWGIHTFRTKNIALVYVNTIARNLYTIRSYNYHCLFNEISQDNGFDRAAFLAYEELDNALQILIADTPRQVINVLTLRYYATDGELSNDIIKNIRHIATTNLQLSVILSFMCLSVAIWSFFFFKFLSGILCYLPVLYSLRKKGFKSLKKYCCKVVNNQVRLLVLKHHKPNDELLEQGILDLNQIKQNPLLNNESLSNLDDDFEYRAVYSDKRPSAHRSVDTLRVEEYPLQNFGRYNPFDDENKLSSTDLLIRSRNPSYNESDEFDSSGRASKDRSSSPQRSTPIYQQKPPARAYTQPTLTNPFEVDNMTSQTSLIYDHHASTNPFERKGSASSLTLAAPSNAFNDNIYPPRHEFADARKVRKRPTYPLTDIVSDYDEPSHLTINHSSTKDSLSETPYPVRGVSLYANSEASDGPDKHETSRRGYPL